jgi:hypothetical protein
MMEALAHVTETAAGWARFGVKLLLIEMFVPGGTLVVIALLWVRRHSSGEPWQLPAPLQFLTKYVPAVGRGLSARAEG